MFSAIRATAVPGCGRFTGVLKRQRSGIHGCFNLDEEFTDDARVQIKTEVHK